LFLWRGTKGTERKGHKKNYGGKTGERSEVHPSYDGSGTELGYDPFLKGVGDEEKKGKVTGENH